MNIPETCNGLDDDCDGEVDETFTLLGDTCDGDDSDQCANGVIACAPNALGTLCKETGPDFEEICNEVDDDCDGLVDEGFTVIPEFCNGVDDDCDGLVDESFENLGAPCDGSDADSCANGTFTYTERH